VGTYASSFTLTRLGSLQGRPEGNYPRLECLEKLRNPLVILGVVKLNLGL